MSSSNALAININRDKKLVIKRVDKNCADLGYCHSDKLTNKFQDYSGSLICVLDPKTEHKWVEIGWLWSSSHPAQVSVRPHSQGKLFSWSKKENEENSFAFPLLPFLITHHGKKPKLLISLSLPNRLNSVLCPRCLCVHRTSSQAWEIEKGSPLLLQMVRKSPIYV